MFIGTELAIQFSLGQKKWFYFWEKDEYISEQLYCFGFSFKVKFYCNVSSTYITTILSWNTIG